jgi:signal transduction histidine kinase
MPDLPPLSQQESRTLLRQLAHIVDISLQLNSTLDPDELLRFIIRTAADLLDCEAASILLYDEVKDELCFTMASGTDAKQLAQIPVPIEGSLAGTIFKTNQPLVINDVMSDPRHYAQVGVRLQFEPRTLLGVPMCIKDRTTGVLEALNKRDGSFTNSDVRLLSIIASQAAVAIHNARLVRDLQIAYDELRRIDKIKSDFIAIASHELRTPLGLILGYSTFLKDEAQGEASEHAQMVFKSAVRMRSLIEAMTNMNLLQMGSLELSLKKLQVQALVESALNDVAPEAQVKRIQLEKMLPPDPIYVEADKEKLSRALMNILNNSVRFTNEGGLVRIKMQPTPDEVHLTFEDTGIGIAADELENIFKEFYQVEDHMTRRHEGLGLGLSIARGIIELHRGRITARSGGLGLGATFDVVLPRSK